MPPVPLPVAGLITLLSTGSVTVRRRAQRTLSPLGESEPGAFVDVVIDEAVVHPASAATLEQLPVANRSDDLIEVYTRSQLRTAQGNRVPDEVLYQGGWYKVTSVSDYATQGLVYFALAERIRS